MTRTAATASAFAFNGGGSGKRSSSFTVAFLLVATVVLADVIGFGECRSFLEDRQQLQRDRRDVGDRFDTEDYVSDGAGDDDDDSESETGGGNKNNPPSILTVPFNVEAAEGTTVQLPCKVSEGSLDEVALIWINGSKSIMTDAFPSSTDPRVKPGPTTPSSSGPTDHTLIIEQVSRWDSGQYTCRITSTPFVQITHTLNVSHMNPATILSIQSAGASGPLNTGTKKLVVKQGDPVQLICNVAGHPTPTVQWTKRAKHHQNSTKHAAAVSAAGQELQNPVVQQQPMPTVVSNTNEVRIESVSAHQHAGFYECLARNSADESVVARSGIDLEVEYQPEVTVPRSVVNTGETYTAQLYCVVHSHPKPKVTWEKELVPGGVWQPVVTDGNNPNVRYDANKVTNAAVAAAAAGTQITSNGSAPPVFALKVKQVQGPQDFGNYRCKAENKLGTTHSTNILLTGAPARPRSTYVQVKQPATAGLTETSELGWTVDSWSPLMEYQLQYKKQEDSSWKLVKPQPPVTESVANNAGDERKYTMSYVFGADGHQSAADVVPSSLEQGTTYVARLRARNVHGWSDWSTDVVLSGGMNDGQGTNEINHPHDDSNNVSKAVVGGSSGASDPRQSRAAVATTVFLAAALAVANAVC